MNSVCWQLVTAEELRRYRAAINAAIDADIEHRKNKSAENTAALHEHNERHAHERAARESEQAPPTP